MTEVDSLLREIRAASLGDEAAFNSLYERHRGKGVAFAMRCAKGLMDKTEADVEYGLALWDAVRDYEPGEGATFYTYTCWKIRGRVRALRDWYGRARFAPLDDLDVSDDYQPPAEADPSVQAVLATLDRWGRRGDRWARDAELLRLRFGLDSDPLELETIGRMFGYSKQYASAQIKRVLGRFRDEIEPALAHS